MNTIDEADRPEWPIVSVGPAFEGPYEAVEWMGGRSVVAHALEGVESNFKDGRVRLADLVANPDVPEASEKAVARLLAAAPPMREALVAILVGRGDTFLTQVGMEMAIDALEDAGVELAPDALGGNPR